MFDWYPVIVSVCLQCFCIAQSNIHEMIVCERYEWIERVAIDDEKCLRRIQPFRYSKRAFGNV